ncbi:MAG: hypothetical protein IJ638_04250, partial [Alphaproteobacteria bacterium]|nr:hypothetical protein [Alphaproteobacteria bacterium]
MDNEKNSLSRNIEKIINFANKTKKAGYKSFIEDLLSINVDITLNAVQETAIYMTKIKKNNNLLSIDELITPLEEAVRIYVNFRKSFPNLKTNQISYLKGNIGIKKLSNTLKNSIKKYAPSLLNEITSD